MRWCRLYVETPSDPKLRRIAHCAGTSVSHTLAVWTSMLCQAAQNEGEAWGTIAGWDDLDCAVNLGIDRAIVFSIRQEMEGRTLDGERIIKWEHRQAKSDTSADRMRRWREKKNEQKQQPANDVTSPDRHRDVTVTACDGLEENRREEKKSTSYSPSSRQRADAASDPDFDRFWSLYPRKVGKGAARRAWASALRRAEEGSASILAGITVQTSLDRFDMREDGRFVPHPATWLNGDRWLDGMEPELGETLLDRRTTR